MRRILLAVPALLLTPLLHAQAIEAYGTLGEVHATNVPSRQILSCPGPNCPLTVATTSSFASFSYGGGVTLNLIRLPLISLGLDARASTHSGRDGALLGLAGLKLTIKPPIFRIHPYLQGSAGYLKTTASGSGSATNTSYFAAEAFAGLDLPVLPHIDLRALEVGGGHAVSFSKSSLGASPTLFTVNSGLVLHF